MFDDHLEISAITLHFVRNGVIVGMAPRGAFVHEREIEDQPENEKHSNGHLSPCMECFLSRSLRIEIFDSKIDC